MKRRGFTMIELLIAIFLLGVLTALTTLTYSSITNGWQTATDYVDKLDRTDFALSQIISGLRSAYYPHNGNQDERYGFRLENKGEGETPRESDVISWTKKGSAIVGSASALADSVHRVQVMVLEEGNHDYRDEIEVTGLYARLCSDEAISPKDDKDGTDYSFKNEEMYQPTLIADGVVGFNCRVMEKPPAKASRKGENDERAFEDEFAASNAVPFKVELTFYMADKENPSYRRHSAPIMRIVELPIYEQSLDGSATPVGDKKGAARAGRSRK